MKNKLIISVIMIGLVSLVLIATGFGLVNPVLAQTDAPSITLITPSAGEIWQAGTQQNITWTTVGAREGKVRLFYKDYMDKNWYPIVSTENTGIYQWNLPYIDSQHLQIQAIWEYYDDDLKVKLLEVKEISEEFSIYIRDSKKEVLITSPSADKIWNSESQQTINWTFDKGVGGVAALAYRQGPNEKWVPIDIIENANQYRWTVPQIYTNQAQVRVTWQSGKEDYAKIYVTSVSDSFFIVESIYTQTQLSPTAPASLSADLNASSQILLHWEDKSKNEDGFKIERRKESGDFSQITVLDSNINTYTDSGLIPGNTYSYRVRAYNEGGNSAYSNVVYVLIPEYNTHNNLRFVIGKPYYSLNGVQKDMDMAPIITEGRTLLPIRYVTEPLGANLDWEPVEKKVTVRLKGTIIELWVDKNTARINGQDRFIDPLNAKVVPIISASGRVMLPVRFITENLGYQITWNQTSQTLTIISPVL
jgi:hypothetical protein